MTDKIKITQQEFDELYEIDQSEEQIKEIKKEETVLDKEEQSFDDKLEDMQEWGQQS